MGCLIDPRVKENLRDEAQDSLKRLRRL